MNYLSSSSLARLSLPLLALPADAGHDRSAPGEGVAPADELRAGDGATVSASEAGDERAASEAATSATAASRVAERDLALVFDPASVELIRASDARDDGDAFLPPRWFDRVVDALPFDVGLGTGRESPYFATLRPIGLSVAN
jgi:hypothetical protein